MESKFAFIAHLNYWASFIPTTIVTAPLSYVHVKIFFY